ncbi:unnamed protein product, partial [Prorocentrum cordatum]
GTPPHGHPGDGVVALRAGAPQRYGGVTKAPPEEAGGTGGRVSQHHEGGARRSELLSDRLLRFPIGDGPCKGAPQEPAPGTWLDQFFHDDTEEERPSLLQPGGVLAMYQGRLSHPRLGTTIPMQIELFWASDRVTGTWFMLRRCVDAVAEATSEWPLVVRSVGGGSGATLWGKDPEVSPNRFAGEVCFGGDAGGTFELLRCPRVSLAPGADVCWGALCGRGGPPAAVVQETAFGVLSGAAAKAGGRCEGCRAGRREGRRAGLPDGSQLIFTTEAQLAEAVAEVLKMHPNGLDMAQLKPTIHRIEHRPLGLRGVPRLQEAPQSHQVFNHGPCMLDRPSASAAATASSGTRRRARARTAGTALPASGTDKMNTFPFKEESDPYLGPGVQEGWPGASAAGGQARGGAPGCAVLCL